MKCDYCKKHLPYNYQCSRQYQKASPSEIVKVLAICHGYSISELHFCDGNRTVIPESDICDGSKQCLDDSDEENCEDHIRICPKG